MGFIIYLIVIFSLGFTFIYQFSKLIERIVKGEEYKREKDFSAILFGLILLALILAETN